MIQDKFPVINDEEISIVPINSLLEQEKINNRMARARAGRKRKVLTTA